MSSEVVRDVAAMNEIRNTNAIDGRGDNNARNADDSGNNKFMTVSLERLVEAAITNGMDVVE